MLTNTIKSDKHPLLIFFLDRIGTSHYSIHPTFFFGQLKLFLSATFFFSIIICIDISIFDIFIKVNNGWSELPHRFFFHENRKPQVGLALADPKDWLQECSNLNFSSTFKKHTGKCAHWLSANFFKTNFSKISLKLSSTSTISGVGLQKKVFLEVFVGEKKS